MLPVECPVLYRLSLYAVLTVVTGTLQFHISVGDRMT